MFVVYVLYSVNHQKIYIGYTSALIDRFHSHNKFSTRGYTVKYRPWIVVHVEFFESKIAALKREKEIKSSRGRDFIWNQIKQGGLLSVRQLTDIGSSMACPSTDGSPLLKRKAQSRK